MFDLEKSIADWRGQMLAAGIKFPAPLEELESHLREEIERQRQSGLSKQKAFEISVRQIGEPQPLKSEFKKVEMTSMKKSVQIAAVFSLGVALQLPGSVQLRDELIMADDRLGLWLLGLVLQMWSVESLRRMIQPKVTGRELEKIEMSLPKPTLKSGAGIVVLLIGITSMLPAAAQVLREGAVQFAGLSWLVFGIALLITGAVVTFCPYKKRIA